MNALDTFLFDLDGTLIDSVEVIRLSFEHALREHCGLAAEHDEWLAGLGTPLSAQFRRYVDDPAEVERMIATYRAHNAAHHDALVRGYPDVREMLDGLVASGVKLGIVTSKQRGRAIQGLEHCGLGEIFELVIGVDEVTRHKPHPEPVLAALAALGAEAERAIYVGDSPHDLAAGRAAGTRTAAALWGPFPRAWLEPERPDHWLATPLDLLALAGPRA
ncbi:MAG: HAD-IA family hydrolase [Planctomycetes bacterium]|nr:HAD-IA family hydrolase [Planctomycetota bacterium]